MIQLKVLISIVIILLSSYVGIAKANIYVKREYTLREILKLLMNIKMQINYTANRKKEILDDASKMLSNNVKENIYNTEKIECLINEDIKIIKAYIEDFGNLDLDSEIQKNEMCIENIKLQINDATYQKEKNNKLYKSLGIILGIGIVIILI